MYGVGGSVGKTPLSRSGSRRPRMAQARTNSAVDAIAIQVRTITGCYTRSVHLSTYLMSGRIQSLDKVAQDTRTLQKSGKRVVFTNGCFDILHAGHVDLLRRARDLGDA